MKKIKNNIMYKIIPSILFSILLISCDRVGDFDPGATTTTDFSGDWYIDLKDSDNSDIVDHALHSTYNTSANDNTMWIDDHQNGYWIKCKITVDLKTGTFTASESENLIDGSKVTITDGKFEKGAAMSKAGHKVDKISFRAHFDYDADGYDILYEGHKRTGFKEDEY